MFSCLETFLIQDRLISHVSYDKIPDTNNLRGAGIYFGLCFQGFHSILPWPYVLGQNIVVVEVLGGGGP
jgi:hypothetical protein